MDDDFLGGRSCFAVCIGRRWGSGDRVFYFREALSHYELSFEYIASFQYPCFKQDPENYTDVKRRFYNMKLRAVIIGMVFLMLVLCSVSQNWAAYGDRKGVRPFDQVVEEHPWQESGAPICDDIESKLTISRFFIIIGPAKIIILNNILTQKATLIEDSDKDNSTTTFSGT
jgi:hypothetical protein